MKQQVLPLQSSKIEPVRDSFSDSCPAGRVIGTKGSGGCVRKGSDLEGVIAIDHQALRFQPLITPGWGRQGVVYGPFVRVNGLAFAAFLVNGHNTSQAENIGQRFLGRLWRWVRGSETEPPWVRLWRLLFIPQNKGLIRRFIWWFRSTPKRWRQPNLDDNLAVGWFSREVSNDPLTEGNAFIIRASRGDNGQLCAQVGSQLLAAFKGLQNIQTYYVVILREKGAAYYAASVSHAHGLVAYPNMRPIAIDSTNEDAAVYAGLYQSVLGQIGFRVDTRVYGVHIEHLPQFDTWYGTAHAADRLVGKGELHHALAEIGGRWTVYSGSYELTNWGAEPTAIGNLAILHPDTETPAGLIHILLKTPNELGSGNLIWRFEDEDNFWELQLSDQACQLRVKQDGNWETIAQDAACGLVPQAIHAVQILDDGNTFTLYLDGKLLFGNGFSDQRLQQAIGVGIGAEGSSVCFQALEAHPRSLPIPAELDLGSPWIAAGQQTVVMDHFKGAATDLQGRITPIGNRVWRKAMGKGRIILTGNGDAKVEASVQQPNPGRTAYTLGWNTSTFADVEVTITPPGTANKQKERGRGGLIFWQDANNYLTFSAYLDDEYNGASIAVFSYLNGYEELYDAVWTMVGKRIHWGIPYRFRVVFDGNHFTAYVDEEPVLYRALTDIYPNARRFRINRVGILANWEWGDDTGSLFSNFIAKE